MTDPLTTDTDTAPYKVNRAMYPNDPKPTNELARLRGENAVLRDLLGECGAVLSTIDEDDSDEAEKLAELIAAIDNATQPTATEGALL